MSGQLFTQAMGKFSAGVILVGLCLFLPAGSFGYWQGWLLMGLLFIPMFFAGLVMMVGNPALLASRLKAKEQAADQGRIIRLSGLMFLVGFLLAGLGHRFGWYTLPNSAVAVGSVLFLAGYLLYGEVLRENAYLSRIIEVQQGQTVVDTGLYGWVRHPMYSATLLLFLSMPLVLGSVYAFLVFLLYPVLIVRRLLAEEVFLEQHLPGYTQYKQKVKYRLIPFLW